MSGDPLSIPAAAPPLTATHVRQAGEWTSAKKVQILFTPGTHFAHYLTHFEAGIFIFLSVLCTLHAEVVSLTFSNVFPFTNKK